MNILSHLDLLSVGLTVAATAVLGFAIYFSNSKSITNRTLLYFSLITILWSVVNYLNYQSVDSIYGLLLIRLTVFFGVFHAFFFFQLFYVFPQSSVPLPRWYRHVLVPVVVLVALLTLGPLMFSRATHILDSGRITGLENGPLLPFFGITVLGLIASGVVLLIRKTKASMGHARQQITTILIGTTVTFLLLITFNFIFPAFLNRPEYIPLGAVFIFPFILTTAYATIHQRMFKVKVISTALLVFILAVVLFAEVIYATSLSLILFRSGTLLLVLIFGISLIRSVLREVELREHIESLIGDLKKANQGQTNLIHIINHQIKGYLSKGRNIFSEFLTNPTYSNSVTGAAKEISQQGFDALTEGAQFVQEVLSASSIENGTMQYTMTPLDLKALLIEVIEKQRPAAEKKNLSYHSTIEEGDYSIVGDGAQLKQAFRNLIDNAIRYTLRGSIAITLARTGDTIQCSITDTGVGIIDEDKPRLFTSGGRGKESQRVNVDSTGFGLSFVKGVIDAHHGTVVGDSEGENKGSVFTVTLPAKNV